MKSLSELKADKCTDSQLAVWRNGGSTPQKRQCKFETLYPAGGFVEAAVRQAARMLGAICG